VFAIDPEGDPVTLHTTQLPAYGTFTDNGGGSGTLTFQPKDDDQTTVGVQACDAGGCTAETFPLTVKNVSPLAAAENNGPITAGGTVTVTAHQADPGADTFTYAFDCSGSGAYSSYGPSNTTTCSFSSVGNQVVGVKVRDDDGGVGTASTTVAVQAAGGGPLKTGALSMGYWQNPNGQATIKNGASTGVACNSGTWLRSLGPGPYKDLSATANCGDVAKYVYNAVKGGGTNCGGSTCNTLLKAQMLATALDVYFSDPALGGNKIAAPAPIGPVSIDLTRVCTNIPQCTTFEDDHAVFGGTPRTVQQMLTYAANQSNSDGSNWYRQNKSNQVKAKDALDAINNQVALGP
jgi:hypothetical protein